MLAPDPDGRWVAAFLLHFVVPALAVIAVSLGLLVTVGRVVRDQVVHEVSHSPTIARGDRP
jgi:hypothetical protein